MTERAPPRDHRREVTDRVVELMESGTAPWQQTWENRPLHMPMNPTTGKSYRGGNVRDLLIEATQRGFEDPRWSTYKQSAEKGWQVRKIERVSPYVDRLKRRQNSNRGS